MQTRPLWGLRAGRVGWVIDEWPRTRILFEDGRDVHVSEALDSVLDVTDDYVDDLDAIFEHVSTTSGTFRKKNA